jgi:hypothetical protein
MTRKEEAAGHLPIRQAGGNQLGHAQLGTRVVVLLDHSGGGGVG